MNGTRMHCDPDKPLDMEIATYLAQRIREYKSIELLAGYITDAAEQMERFTNPSAKKLLKDYVSQGKKALEEHMDRMGRG